MFLTFVLGLLLRWMTRENLIDLIKSGSDKTLINARKICS